MCGLLRAAAAPASDEDRPASPSLLGAAVFLEISTGCCVTAVSSTMLAPCAANGSVYSETASDVTPKRSRCSSRAVEVFALQRASENIDPTLPGRISSRFRPRSFVRQLRGTSATTGHPDPLESHGSTQRHDAALSVIRGTASGAPSGASALGAIRRRGRLPAAPEGTKKQWSSQALLWPLYIVFISRGKCSHTPASCCSSQPYIHTACLARGPSRQNNRFALPVAALPKSHRDLRPYFGRRRECRGPWATGARAALAVLAGCAVMDALRWPQTRVLGGPATS
jgi:hypothetical protein